MCRSTQYGITIALRWESSSQLLLQGPLKVKAYIATRAEPGSGTEMDDSCIMLCVNYYLDLRCAWASSKSFLRKRSRATIQSSRARDRSDRGHLWNQYKHTLNDNGRKLWARCVFLFMGLSYGTTCQMKLNKVVMQINLNKGLNWPYWINMKVND